MVAMSTLTLKKEPNTKVGVRLMDGKNGSVKIDEVAESSPLAGLVGKGDVLVSINGDRCNQGHKQAAEMLRSATGQVEVVLQPKTPSTVSKLFSRKSSRSAAPSPSEAIMIKSEVISERSGKNLTATSAVADYTGSAMAVEEDATVQSAPGGSEQLSVAEDAPTGAATKPDVTPEPSPPKSAVGGLAAGEYTVVLKRQNTSSIGMRLVQKRFDDLPTIADIDKDGPASQTDIQIDDVLLKVNGVDARAPAEDLKRALGSKKDAVLVLRRDALRPPADLPAANGTPAGVSTIMPVANPSLKLSRCCGFRGAD